MKTALLRIDDREEITADEAAVKNERKAFCPICEQEVRLHNSKKIANHFEHLPSTTPCRLRYHSDQQQ
jgi:competence CoiA-like predicted nuclease